MFEQQTTRPELNPLDFAVSTAATAATEASRRPEVDAGARSDQRATEATEGASPAQQAAYQAAFAGYAAVEALGPRPQPDNDAPAPLPEAEVEKRRLQADAQITAKAAVTLDSKKHRMDQKLARRLAQMTRSDTFKGGSSKPRALDQAHQEQVEQLVFFANFTDPDRGADAPPDAQIYAYLNLNRRPDGSVEEEWRVFEVVGPSSHAYQAQADGAGTNSWLGLPISGRATDPDPDHKEWAWFQKFEGGTLAGLADPPGWVQRYDLQDQPVGEPYHDTAPLDLELHHRTVSRSDLVPNQYAAESYTNDDHHKKAYYDNACGCAAYTAMMRSRGAPMDLSQACDLAQGAHAWAPGVGWFGAQKWGEFANSHGCSVAAWYSLNQESRAAIDEAVQAHQVVVVSNLAHYWVIEGWDESKQLYYMGNSGPAGNGQRFMSLEQIAAIGGTIGGVFIPI